MRNDNPANVVCEMIDAVLAMAKTWPNWDGRPVDVDGRVMTPGKALRRVADHTIDHLAEAQARISGVASLPDGWHHSAKTTRADLAPVSGDDLNEARERLLRLGELWRLAYRDVPAVRLDEPTTDGAMTLRELLVHTAESIEYAEMLGAM